ncbi:hypothetical protein EVAR_55146_1 [Eumeta japonica]|uniref:Uncharacterized protein n=1 Tax=Eumeta variegata TaxID=151549 RepID=A0A4C1Y9R3_EUMVA|nr:hypothetical protein EVAR_55146_1 [Eumeta japonica]
MRLMGSWLEEFGTAPWNWLWSKPPEMPQSTHPPKAFIIAKNNLTALRGGGIKTHNGIFHQCPEKIKMNTDVGLKSLARQRPRSKQYVRLLCITYVPLGWFDKIRFLNRDWDRNTGRERDLLRNTEDELIPRGRNRGRKLVSYKSMMYFTHS